MHRRRRNVEVALHLCFRRRVPVKLGIVVDERQVLPLFLRVMRHRSFLQARRAR